MDWIKRNLLFAIGATVALVLMVGAGFYTWSGWSHNAKALDDLNGKYEELKRLTNLNPNPGSGKVDNIKAAREQQQAVRGAFAQAAKQFETIPAIPEGANVSVEAFANSLSRTIFTLQREATNAGITLSPKYSFSFQQQSSLMKFAAGSVGPLAMQLGEVKALCDVLIAAKINSLESIQRERVSADDQAGQQTDYLDLKTETNELAVLTPYQITFRSFTPEVAAVLCGFSRSPNGIIVKSFNVELAPAIVAEVIAAPVVTYVPAPVAAPPPQYGKDSVRDAFRERYGPRGQPGLQPPIYAPPPVVAPIAPPVSTAPRAVLNEKQLKVTMLVQVVKLLPKK
jgi:hypothetical protein